MGEASAVGRLIRSDFHRYATINRLYVAMSAVMVALLYAVLALIEDDALFAAADRYTEVSAAAPSVLLVLLVVALLFTIIFLLYMNTLLIERRARSISVYRLLGMPAGRIGLTLFYESLLLGAQTLVIGFALGLLLSKFLAMMLLRLMALPMTVGLLWQPHAMLELVAVFTVVYAVIGVINGIYVAHIPIGRRYQLPAQGLPTRVTGWRMVWATVGWVLLIGSYLGAYNLVHLAYAVSQSRFGHGYVVLWAVLAVGLVGLYLVFRYSLPTLTSRLVRLPFFRHHAVRLLTLTNLNERLQRNVHSLFLTTLLATGTITVLGSGAIFYQFGQAGVNQSISMDLAASPYGLKTTYHDLNPDWIKQTVVLPTKLAAGRLHTQHGQPGDGDETFYNVIALKDYQRIAKVQKGLAKLTLKPGQAVMAVYGRSLYQHTWLNQRRQWSITLPRTGQKFQLQSVSNQFPLGVDGYFDRALIVTDHDYQALAAPRDPMTGYRLKSGKQVEAFVKKAANASRYDFLSGSSKALTGEKSLQLSQTEHAGSYSRSALRLKGPLLAQMNMLFGLGLFVVILLGLIFMIATASILLMKQLIIAFQERQSRQIIRALGMPTRAMHQIINWQTTLIFGLPLVVGTFNAWLIIHFFSLYLDNPGYSLVVMIVLIYALVYAGFGALTARLVRRS
ncbi:MAG: ABC transporter permease [Lactobacillus sp.]|jgi:putative ABC transport system permease protein|nr:ABC transporter permease [Lactobacillus sp.]